MNPATGTVVKSPYQAGAALIVSLLFLLIMTLIGVTAMQVATLEERMSGNLRSKNMAFQSAETALRAGEAALNTLLASAVPPAFDCANGMYGRAAPNDADCDGVSDDLPVWQTVDWNSNAVVTVNLDGVPNPPAYIIEYMYKDIGLSSKCDPPVGDPPASTCQCYYRITARGTGNSSSSVSILQSTYSRPSIKVNNYGDCHA
jgi:type IV pilus assembly protein PilX